MSIRSYTYERFLVTTGPQAGFQFGLTADFNARSAFSDVTAQRLNGTGEYLYNLNNYDPPLWIFGLRYGFGLVFTGEDSRAALPANFFQYLGGSQNLRGFGRLELPNDGQGGGLTSAFLGAEVRLSQTLPFNVDPFLFVDLGGIGRTSFSFDLPLFWSPGVGLRWASPIGPVRTTLAQGFIGNTSDHLQLYISLGEEF
jgi:translocation and assembly module TamA